MIEAYKIGVELVLGGDLAAGIEALIPGLVRLDGSVAQANAEAKELAAGLASVAGTAPGIGQAADAVERLNTAMVSMNRAVAQLRSGGGLPEAAVRAVKAPDAPPVAGRTGPAIPASRAVGEPVAAGIPIPPMLDDGAVRTMVGASVGAGDGKTELPRRAATPEPVSPARALAQAVQGPSPGSLVDSVNGSAKPLDVPPGGQPARTATRAARGPLPAYLEKMLAQRPTDRDDAAASPGPTAAWRVATARAGETDVPNVVSALARVSGPNARLDLPRAAPPELNQVLPTLSGSPQAKAPDRAALVAGFPTMSGRGAQPAPADGRTEPRPQQQPTPPLVRPKSDIWNTVAGPRQQVASVGISSRGKQPQPTVETNPEAPAAWPLHTSAGATVRPLQIAAWNAFETSLDQVARDPASPAPNGRSTPQAPADPAAGRTYGRSPAGAPAWGTDPPGLLAANTNGPHRNAAPGATGLGALSQLHAYHPQGDQAGPVIQHVTYVQLDERTIARAVTRQQLRMMGGQVSGTLRPDPSIAPQYGAHLLET